MDIPEQIRKDLQRKLGSGEELSASEKFILAQIVGEVAEGVAKRDTKIKPDRVKVFVPSRRKRRDARDWENTLDKVVGLVGEAGKPMKGTKLAKMLGVGIGGTYSRFLAMLSKDKRLQIIKNRADSRVKYFALADYARPVVHEEPMKKKSPRAKFMSDRTKAYMKSGLPYFEASRMAVADYSKVCQARKKSFVVFRFPSISSISERDESVVKGLLTDMERRGTKVGFEEVSYLLDNVDVGRYNELVLELISKSEHIAKALGTTKRLVIENSKLMWK